jgi:uncharacterized protein (DUF1810 family)
MTEKQSDRYDLRRFVEAQEPVYGRVCDELRAGEKRTHWIWYIFPQIAGLGRSPMAQRYAISGLGEAKAYLQHDVLGARLKECTRLVLGVPGRSIQQIFGDIDSIKFRSSMTLFAHAAPDERDFAEALAKYFAGQADDLTLRQIEAG